ncbi:MAG: peptidase U34 [Anaerolineae bacterium]|nr:peptidase U34 [Anaerolineae bacterium]
MCDTFVALADATPNGTALFAKNSDRDPNEAHHLLLIPAADHPLGAQVQCTYTAIPQVAHTHAVLLAKPFWIWGAEMGANQHGVVIGNEALFSRLPAGKKPGLIGMDLLRLALERAASAAEALEVIIQLIESYGQSGNCGFSHPIYYHNSFLIADPHQAWVLETVDRQWAAEQVHTVRSISNAITIGGRWDRASSDLVRLAVQRGWCRRAEDFDFARCYSDRLYTRFADGVRRQQCSTQALHAISGRLNTAAMMDILRSHRADPSGFAPDAALTGADICMHAGFGPIRISQTTGSMVSQLTPERQTHWLTGCAAPCLALFFPVWMDAGLPNMGAAPGGRYNPQSFFWQHERLHRAVLADYPTRAAAIQPERQALQEEFIAEAEAAQDLPAAQRLALSQRCVDRARQAYARWLEQVCALPIRTPPRFYYRSAWDGFNRAAAMPPATGER